MDRVAQCDDFRALVMSREERTLFPEIKISNVYSHFELRIRYFGLVHILLEKEGK